MTPAISPPATGPLNGIRILDLSRILAGPICTQLLGDYGADIIKIEKPGAGDDTRSWGPPFVKDADGNDTEESTFYLCANRNKRSVAVDISQADGQALIRKLLGKCDVLIENFRVGALSKYGLGYDELRDEFPALVYCSITGFGQTGPYRDRAGYDFLAQGMGGIMSVTGEPEGVPMKTGVGIADIMTGMHASTGILAALRHRDATGSSPASALQQARRNLPKTLTSPPIPHVSAIVTRCCRKSATFSAHAAPMTGYRRWRSQACPAGRSTPSAGYSTTRTPRHAAWRSKCRIRRRDR